MVTVPCAVSCVFANALSEMGKPLSRLGQIIGRNCRQHAARDAAIKRLGELEADRAEACHGDTQRGFRVPREILRFGLGVMFHSENFGCVVGLMTHSLS